MLEKHSSRPGAPNWIICELCKIEGLHSQPRFVIAENDTVEKSLEFAELVLLCEDCSAVAKGEIDASEWKSRKLRCEKMEGRFKASEH